MSREPGPDQDRAGDRESPLVYDGGLRIEDAEDSFVPLDHRVFITCYSALTLSSRWALAVKHGTIPKQIRCPLCHKRAIAELEQDGDDE